MAGRDSVSGAESDYYSLEAREIAAWSPDGRYLYLPLGSLGRLATPAVPSTDTLNGNGCFQLGPAGKWLQVPVRDAGMAHAIARLDPTTNYQTTLSWSPDGTRLAAELATQPPATQNTPLVTIYDCHTGTILAKLTAHQLGMQPDPTQAATLSDPMWSPDGSRLLLLKMDQARGDYSLMVFGYKSLAATPTR